MPKPTANVRQGGGAGRFWTWLGFDLPADKARARALVGAAAQASRQAALFGPGRVEDTFSGRFEMATLFAVLLTRRLGRDDGEASLAQAVANRIFASFDEALREAGEGDLSVAKRMKGLARAFYGRARAYGAALDAGDTGALAGALARNVWAEGALADDRARPAAELDERGPAPAAPFAATLAAYAMASEKRLNDLSIEALASPENWPKADALL